MSDQSWEALSHSNRNLTVDQGTRWISSCCKPENRQIKLGRLQFSSVAQSCLTLCNPMNHRPPCPSPTPGIYPNSCPSSHWCHPIIPSSVVPFSSCPQSFPGSGSFQVTALPRTGRLQGWSKDEICDVSRPDSCVLSDMRLLFLVWNPIHISLICR